MSRLLIQPGWTPDVRGNLERLIRTHRGRHLPVAFDFDNTLVCGDIGEATLAILARRGWITPKSIPTDLSPTVVQPGRRRITPASPPDVTAYYEALLAPTVHASRDPMPLANGYAWAVQAMAGRTALDVVRAAEEACSHSMPHQVRRIEVTPGQTAYPAPFFYPEMVELIAQFVLHQFAVWIVSASNVWSVRWMVRHLLDPMLLECGAKQGIPPEQVIGVSVLLSDRRGRLHKDACLVRENPAYTALDPQALAGLQLTPQLQFPVPTYSGKVGCLWDALGQPPFFAAGDSPGDHAMLSFSRHRLWIARLDKPDYQAATAKRIQSTGPKGWILQPTLSRDTPCFVADPKRLPPISPGLRPKVLQSLRTIARGV